MSRALEDAGLEQLPAQLGCKMQKSATVFERAIRQVTRLTPAAAARRAATIRSLGALSDTDAERWDAQIAEAAAIETELAPFLQPTSDDLKALQEDTLGQLTFQHEKLRCLNYIPWVLTALSLFKVYAVPLMAVLTPIVAWILPYVILKFMVRLPISQTQYNDILKILWAGGPFALAPGPGGKLGVTPPSLTTPRSIFQTILMGASFAQSLIQPIQTALHLYRTDCTLVENGRKVLRLAALYRAWANELETRGLDFPFREPLEDLDSDDPRRALMLLLEQPRRAELAFRDLAELELLWRIARSPLLRPATVLPSEGGGPLVQIRGGFDLRLGSGAVPSDITFGDDSLHAALTGPNGGGKSSYLRAVLQCVLLAQAYGVAPAAACTLRRFRWIVSGLRLQDAPGELSMFETEVYFAAQLLRRTRAEAGPGLVLYDELFHSTNPPDGTRTAEVFLKQLWQSNRVVSIVSTHVFSLVEAAPAAVQRICCKARVAADGEIEYAFRVEPGVCQVSSVRSIWKRFGLVRAPPRQENLGIKKKPVLQ